MNYDEVMINKDINICFFDGKVVSEPEFKFFYNSKIYISKVYMWLQTEYGFNSSKNSKSILIRIVAYDDMADYIYQNIRLNDFVMIRGFLQKDEIVISEIIIL